MLPNLNNDNESGQERHTLPSIRDLFGEHLSKPVNKRPPPFSLADLGSSLPNGSASPAYSSGSMLSSSTMTSPRSAWSQASGRNNTGYAGGDLSNAPTSRHRSDLSSQFLTTPSTSPSQDDYLTLPPINPIYSQSYLDTERRTSSPYITTSPCWVSNSHSRSHSTSETELSRDSLGPDGCLEPSSKRRHTIGSSRSSAAPLRSFSDFSRNSTHTGPPFSPAMNPHPPASTHPSLTPNLPPMVDYRAPSSSGPPSPHSTSGDEIPTERKKALAKYECQYCRKRFNRPSSLKLHHNTHTGEKPFACTFPGCGRHFSVLSNMRRHARIHGEPPNPASIRDSSVEDNFEASTVCSSSSSTHNTPSSPQTAKIPPSEKYSPSHSSCRLEPPRHPSPARPHPYSRSHSPLSDQGGSSPER